MSFVIDASVAVKLFLSEEESEAAQRLASCGQELHAPRLLVSEVCNAIWSRARRGQIDNTEATALVDAVSDIPLRWHLDENICTDAIRLSLSYDRSIYDCMYLALAQQIRARLVTADRRFENALSQTEHADVIVNLSDPSLTQ